MVRTNNRNLLLSKLVLLLTKILSYDFNCLLSQKSEFAKHQKITRLMAGRTDRKKTIFMHIITFTISQKVYFDNWISNKGVLDTGLLSKAKHSNQSVIHSFILCHLMQTFVKRCFAKFVSSPTSILLFLTVFHPHALFQVCKE